MSEHQEIKQTIEDLTLRYTNLNAKKIQATTKLEAAQEQLETLKKEALEKYGTDNLEELKNKLNEMKNENETKRAAYQAALNKIEADLLEVENKYQDLELETEDS